MSSQPDRKAVGAAEQVLYDEGMKVREQVLGAEHVKNSRELPELQQPVQSLAASAGWGLCWSRPGLELKTRSLITVSLLTAGGHDHELPAHVRGALNNGCTPEEIMEAIYQLTLPSRKQSSEYRDAALLDINRSMDHYRERQELVPLRRSYYQHVHMLVSFEKATDVINYW